MKRFLGWCTAGLIAAALVNSAPARADISLGYEARYSGLAGAGLAVIDNPTQAGLINPAALSLRTRGFGMQWPNVTFRWQGAGMGEAIGQLASGSLDLNDAADLVKDFGSEAGRVDAGLGFGAAFRAVDLRVQTTASVRVDPRVDLQNPANSGFDVRGAATVAPSLGFGFRVPNGVLGRSNLGDVRVGFRVKPTQVYYSHFVVVPDGSNGWQSQPVAGEDGLKETTLGVDFGALWQPAFVPYTTVGLTVDNLVEPSFRDPATGARLMPRTVNLGASITIPGGLLIAADVLDITGANRANPNGKAQIRAGAEFRPNLPILRLLALRGGYNSATGFAGGLSIGSFGIAYAERAPLVASQTVNF